MILSKHPLLWPTWRGSRSDSVSDRSCHHAALTGCTHYFGIPKCMHARIPNPPGCSHFLTFVNEMHNKILMMCVQINAPGRYNCKFNECRVNIIYVARQNLISPAHVDLNCGKTVSRAPPDWIFSPFAISPRGLLTARCHREQTESRKKLKTFNSARYIEHRRWLERIWEIK